MLRTLLATSSAMAFSGLVAITPANAKFLQPDPIGYADQMNLYAYVRNDPLNNADPTGQYCNTFNRGSGFCSRAQRYADIDGNNKVSGKTTFFAAASLITEQLGSIDGPQSLWFISKANVDFLRNVSESLEISNTAMADAIADGQGFSQGSVQENNRAFVRYEQRQVQGLLDGLRGQNPDQYDTLIKSVNRSLNGPQRYTDLNLGRILDGVRQELGGDIDFANIEHRVAIGDAVNDAIQADRNVTCTGSRLKRASC